MQCTAEDRRNCGTFVFMVFVGLSIGGEKVYPKRSIGQWTFFPESGYSFVQKLRLSEAALPRLHIGHELLVGALELVDAALEPGHLGGQGGDVHRGAQKVLGHELLVGALGLVDAALEPGHPGIQGGDVHRGAQKVLDHELLGVGALTLRIQKQSKGSQGGVLTVPCTFRRSIFQ